MHRPRGQKWLCKYYLRDCRPLVHCGQLISLMCAGVYIYSQREAEVRPYSYLNSQDLAISAATAAYEALTLNPKRGKGGFGSQSDPFPLYSMGNFAY